MTPYLNYICISIIAGFLLAQNVVAQEPTSKEETIADSLVRSGFDTVIIYQPYRCLKGHPDSDTSYVEDIVYLLARKADVLIIERRTRERRFVKGDFFETTNCSLLSLADSLVCPGIQPDPTGWLAHSSYFTF